MRSIDGERLALLTRAIDDLAAEGMADLPPETLVERIADIWSLVEGIDPEIARRRSRYMTSEN
ncbi:hypothetical protein Acsp04_50570 [Actinomadura sp. NBRC 104425]|uniref:hypothetical protein n=1 Tax=Actinomadura sp. NBRC 104425 TaxID=3032204 RepID=UPI0024A49549|nr:hypothetical protein [Actinomadura sp. NBRC 104425]GLZ14822.1 hypothetical protein Acsp04_50570 [Actinomadura sp. NBRC 104425]